MPISRRSRSPDVAIRLAGLSLLPIGAFSISWLYHLVHAAEGHEGTFAELGLAAAGFLCLSMGSMLLALGSHLLAEVEISARWVRRPGAAGLRKWSRLPTEPTDPRR